MTRIVLRRALLPSVVGVKIKPALLSTRACSRGRWRYRIRKESDRKWGLEKKGWHCRVLPLFCTSSRSKQSYEALDSFDRFTNLETSIAWAGNSVSERTRLVSRQREKIRDDHCVETNWKAARLIVS